MHYYEKFKQDKLNAILNLIINENPDYIVITGDLIHDSYNTGDLKILKEFLTRLKEIAPVIMSLGNHDLLGIKQGKYIPHINEEYFNMLYGIHGLHILDNKRKTFNQITFTGITMPTEYYQEGEENYTALSEHLQKIEIAKTPVENELYNITLFHSPITILERPEISDELFNTDLLLSGHMHGGLTPRILESTELFKIRGIIGPTTLKQRCIYPNYSRGHIKVNQTDAIISTGLSKLNLPFTDLIFPPSINDILIEQELEENTRKYTLTR